MKVTVTDGCISCGLCVESFPDLFHWNEEGTAEAVGQVPAGQEDQARQAVEDCPVSVIAAAEWKKHPGFARESGRSGVFLWGQSWNMGVER